MAKFIILEQIKTRKLNGEMVEYKQPFAANVDRIDMLFPTIDNRTLLYGDGEGDGHVIDMPLGELVELLNRQ